MLLVKFNFESCTFSWDEKLVEKDILPKLLTAGDNGLSALAHLQVKLVKQNEDDNIYKQKSYYSIIRCLSVHNAKGVSELLCYYLI